MKVISLYTGAGGLDLGLEASGFKTVVALECNAFAVETLRRNRDWSVMYTDIRTDAASSKNILGTASLGVGEAHLLAGGPPCQPFSKSGYWHSGDSKRLRDPRADTLTHYLRVLRDTAPEVFLLENVPGLAFSTKSEGLQYLRQEVDRINREIGTSYSFSARQLNAAQFGIPQTRQRVFVIGNRNGIDFDFPDATHHLPPRVDMANGGIVGDLDSAGPLKPPTNAWDAIGEFEDDDDPSLVARGKWAALLHSIPEGQNYLFHTNRGGGGQLFGWRSRYWSMLLKLAKRLPSWTLTAQPGPAIGPFHWKSRRLSGRELCALQTFPRGYSVVGPLREQYRQVGNAVPSALTEIIGHAIRRQFFGEPSPVPTAPTLIPTHSGVVPPAEPTGPFPKQYLELVRVHRDHPGTGLGPGASARVG